MPHAVAASWMDFIALDLDISIDLQDMYSVENERYRRQQGFQGEGTCPGSVCASTGEDCGSVVTLILRALQRCSRVSIRYHLRRKEARVERWGSGRLEQFAVCAQALNLLCRDSSQILLSTQPKRQIGLFVKTYFATGSRFFM